MDKARVQAYLQAACSVLNFDIGEIWCCRCNIPDPPSTSKSSSSGKDLRFIQLYTSPHYERHRDKLVIPTEIPDESDVDKHNFSPLICEAVREARQVVWAHTKHKDGLLGRSDLALRTAVGVPVCTIGFDLCILIMFSPDVVELTDDAHRFLFTVAQAAGDAVCGFLPASSSSPVQSTLSLMRPPMEDGEAAGPYTRLLINALPPTVTIQMVDMAAVPHDPVKPEFMEAFNQVYNAPSASAVPPLMPPVPPLMPAVSDPPSSGGVDPLDSLPPLEDCILPDLLGIDEDAHKGGGGGAAGMDEDDWDFEAALDFIFDSNRVAGPVNGSEWLHTQQRAAFDEGEENAANETDSPITYFYKDRLQRVRFEEFVKGFLSMSVFHTAECWVARGQETIEPVFCATCLGDVEKWKAKSAKLYADPNKALPARVSRQNHAIWEEDFDRMNGAAPPRTNAEKAYSVHTAFGLPVHIDRKHRLIVIFYSSFVLKPGHTMESFINCAMDRLWNRTAPAYALLDLPPHPPGGGMEAPHLISADSYTEDLIVASESPRAGSPEPGMLPSSAFLPIKPDLMQHASYPPEPQPLIKSSSSSLQQQQQQQQQQHMAGGHHRAASPAAGLMHQQHQHHVPPQQQQQASYPPYASAGPVGGAYYPAPPSLGAMGTSGGSSYGGMAAYGGSAGSYAGGDSPAGPPFEAPYLKTMGSSADSASSSAGGSALYGDDHHHLQQQHGSMGGMPPGGMMATAMGGYHHHDPHQQQQMQQQQHGYQPMVQQQGGMMAYGGSSSTGYLDMSSSHVNGGSGMAPMGQPPQQQQMGGYYGQPPQQQPGPGQPMLMSSTSQGSGGYAMGGQQPQQQRGGMMMPPHMGAGGASAPGSQPHMMMSGGMGGHGMGPPPPGAMGAHHLPPPPPLAGGPHQPHFTMGHNSVPGSSSGMRMKGGDDYGMTQATPQEYTISSELLDLSKGVNGAMQRKLCKTEMCNQPTAKRSPYCPAHTGARHCQHPGCTKCAQGNTKFCIAHGGGRRCTYPGCTKGARDKNFCAAHGGGKRCVTEGCTKSAVGGSNLCTAHGGGRRCHFQDCTRSAQSSTNFCVRHGGGRKCQVEGCQKVARGRTSFCAAHGGGVRCKVEGCNKAAVGKFQMCRMHSGYPKKRASESISSTHFLPGGDLLDDEATNPVAKRMAVGQHHSGGGGGASMQPPHLMDASGGMAGGGGGAGRAAGEVAMMVAGGGHM